MNRDVLRGMFGGRCAYCGLGLGAVFHADHVAPIWRGNTVKPVTAGADTEDNIVPACPRCNLRKSVLSVERFRSEIMAQVARLRRDSASFRLAEDFGLIQPTNADVSFYFERYHKEASDDQAPDASRPREAHQ